jgi:hypothetical protein
MVVLKDIKKIINYSTDTVILIKLNDVNGFSSKFSTLVSTNNVWG